MRWDYTDTTPLLWPMLPDARFNTLTGTKLNYSSRFFWSEHGGGPGRFSTLYSSLFTMDSSHPDSVKKCKYTLKQVSMHTKNDVEEEEKEGIIAS